MRRFAFIMLWLYVFTIPWEHSTDIGTGIGSVTRIVGIAALMAGLAAVAMCGSIRRLTLFHTTVSVLYLWILSSYLWTVDADATAMAIRTFAQAMWAVWLIWGVRARRESPPLFNVRLCLRWVCDWLPYDARLSGHHFYYSWRCSL